MKLPEKRFEVLRELGSTRITGIHGNENANCGN